MEEHKKCKDCAYHEDELYRDEKLFICGYCCIEPVKHYREDEAPACRYLKTRAK